MYHRADAGALPCIAGEDGGRAGEEGEGSNVAGRRREETGGGGMEPDRGGIWGNGKRAGAVREAGGGKAGSGGGGDGREALQLRGGEWGEQEDSGVSEWSGSGAGSESGGVCGEKRGDGDGAVGDIESGRGVCAAGGAVAEGADGVCVER